MKLIQVLDTNHIQVPRPDVRDALEASQDQYLAQQQTLMKPQLLFANQWVHDSKNIAPDDTVLRMGWAATGHRTLGAPILGVFVVTNALLCFVREGDGEEAIQTYERSKITQAKQSGWLGLRKVSFRHEGEERTWERIHKDNAAFLVEQLAGGKGA